MQHAAMNTLGKWLKANGITHADFGARIGKDKSMVGRIVRGEVNITRETAAAIYRETRSEVTPNDLFGIAPAAKPAPEGAESGSPTERKVA